MIPQHKSGRIHVGALFQEASGKCSDDCGTGTVCFEHMTERLKEVADKIQALELQNTELTETLLVIRDHPDCNASNLAHNVLAVRFCVHPEITHNIKTDKHHCGICYQELDRHCGLCDIP